jgi:hypothetical protein
MKFLQFIGSVLALLFSFILFVFRVTRDWVCTKLRQAQSTLRLARADNHSTRVRMHWLDARMLARGGLSCLFMLLFCVALLGAPRASAQVSSLDLFSMSNATPIIAYGVTSNTFLLTRDCEFGIDGRFFSTNSAVPVGLAGSFSLDTTNFGLMPFTLSGVATSNGVPGSMALTSSNSIAVPTIWTNFNHNVIASFAAVRLYLTNGTPANTTTNLFGGLLINRPTINTGTY